MLGEIVSQGFFLSNSQRENIKSEVSSEGVNALGANATPPQGYH